MQILNIKLGSLFTNCYIITDEKSGEAAVIDPGEYDIRLENAVKDKNVKYILMTHGHSDHISGVKKLKDLTGAKVVIGKDETEFISNNSYNLSPYGVDYFDVDITVHDKDILALGETQIEVISTPGHTKGGVCYVIYSEKLLFSGDTLFKCSVGRTDFETGDYKKIIESIKKLKELDGDFDVFPGHENSTTLGFERKNNMYMRQL